MQASKSKSQQFQSYKPKTENDRLQDILKKNRLINRQDNQYVPPSSSSEEENSSEESDIIRNQESDNDDVDSTEEYVIQNEDDDNLLERTDQALPPVVITPNLTMFWVGMFLVLTLGFLINVGMIYPTVVSWSRNNNATGLIDLIKENIINASFNEGSDCMSCTYDSVSGEYTTHINGIMHTDVNSEIINQFSSNGGIVIDNIDFDTTYITSSNQNTSILFENNMEASNMLISNPPGLISIPLETSSQLSTIGACPSSDILVPSIYAYKQLTGSDPPAYYYICFCESTNKYCHILSQTVV